MKRLLTGAGAATILLLLGSPSFASITCWYKEAGNYTGADSDVGPNFPKGKVSPGNGGDYAWDYTIDGPPSDCPRTVPPH